MPNDSTHRSLVFRLAAGLSFYTLARCAAGAIRLLSVPFIVQAVSAEAFGTLATLWMPLFVVHALGDLGLGTAAVRLAPECQSASDRRSLFATMTVARAALGAVVTAVVAAAHEPLARWVTGSPNNGPVFLWLVLARPTAMVFDGLLDELRSRGAIRALSVLVFLLTCATQGLCIVLSVWLGLGLNGLVWARIIAEVLSFLLAFALCFSFVRGRPSLVHFRRLVAFGWPLGVVYLLGTLRGLDRPLIRALSSLEHVAAYELATRIVGPIGVFNLALGMVLEPFVYGHSKSRRAPELIDVFVRVYVAVVGSAAMLLSLAGPEIVTLFAPEAYRGAIRVLPALVFSATSEVLLRAAGIGADLAKKTGIWALVGVVTLTLGLTLAAVLVPRFGLAGAGAAWVVANAASTLLVYGVARRVSGIPLPVGRSLSLLVAGALLGTVAVWNPWPLALRASVVIAFAALAKGVLGVRWADAKAVL